jgi:hypothetical protein
MARHHTDITDGPNARAITAYCEAAIRALGPTVEGEARWGCPPNLARELQGPYHFIIAITTPHCGGGLLEYRREDIEGYSTGTTTATIQHDILGILKGYRRECLEPC